jgi:hypothetical protein
MVVKNLISNMSEWSYFSPQKYVNFGYFLFLFFFVIMKLQMSVPSNSQKVGTF